MLVIRLIILGLLPAFKASRWHPSMPIISTLVPELIDLIIDCDPGRASSFPLLNFASHVKLIIPALSNPVNVVWILKRFIY
ncbi:hypothetical protein D3C78_1614750 [compost metagenome]